MSAVLAALLATSLAQTPAPAPAPKTKKWNAAVVALQVAQDSLPAAGKKPTDAIFSAGVDLTF